MINLEDSTTTQLLQDGSTLCCQIHGVSSSGQSVLFTDTKSHSVKQFFLHGPILDGTDIAQTVNTVTGNGSSGTETGYLT